MKKTAELLLADLQMFRKNLAGQLSSRLLRSVTFLNIMKMMYVRTTTIVKICVLLNYFSRIAYHARAI